MLAPVTWPEVKSKKSSMNLPKRLELSFKTVWALPNASNSGFTLSSKETCCYATRESGPVQLHCVVSSCLSLDCQHECKAYVVVWDVQLHASYTKVTVRIRRLPVGFCPPETYHKDWYMSDTFPSPTMQYRRSDHNNLHQLYTWQI